MKTHNSRVCWVICIILLPIIFSVNFLIIRNFESSSVPNNRLWDSVPLASNAPTITHPDDIIFFNSTTGHFINWTVTDSGVGTTSYTIYRNGGINTTGVWTSGTPIIRTVNGLAPGVYNYTIIAADGLGGTCRDEVWVSVKGNVGSILWSYNMGTSQPHTTPGCGDIDNDGNNEIIIVGYSGNMTCLSQYGTVKWTYIFPPNFFRGGISLEDIDQDGYKEILVGSETGKFYCINYTGGVKWSYTPGAFINFPAIGDIDKDGDIEVLIASASGKICCLSSTGSWEWEFNSGGAIYSSNVVICDVDNDGNYEALFGAANNRLICLNSSGSQEWAFPTSNRIESSIAVGDINADGKMECIFGTDDKNFYCVNGTGNQTWCFTSGETPESQSTGGPVLGDVDLDGEIEIVIPTRSRFYCLDNQGNAKWNRSFSVGSFNYVSAALSDFDGDSNSEIIVTRSASNYLVCFNGTGAPEWNFTIGAGFFYHSEPTIVDIDQDGAVELLVGSGSAPPNILYCITGSGPSWGQALPWPQVQGSCVHTGNATDTDHDGIYDSLENTIGTDPIDNDTDNDGCPDGWEVQFLLNPLVANGNDDTDGDGMTNILEYVCGRNPRNASSYFSISSVSGEIDPIVKTVNQVVTCDVTESGGAGVAGVNLFYKINSGAWVKVTMSVVLGDTYSGTIPNAAYVYGDTVSYYIEAKDGVNNYLYRYGSGTTSINATAQGTPLTFTATEDVSPSIGIISGEVDPIVETVNQVVTCDVTDSGGAGVAAVNLFYNVNSGSWVKVTMSVVSGNTYSGTIPNAVYLYGDTVSYYIEAKDYANNYLYRYGSGTTSINATAQGTPLTFTATEDISPSIGIISGEVDPIVETVDQVLTCDVTDSGGAGLTGVNLFYKINSDAWVKVTMSVVSGDTYSGTIPNAAYVYGDTVSYYVEAKDGVNNYLYRYGSGTTSINATAQGTPLTFTATEDISPSIGIISGEVDPIVETVDQVVTCDVTDSGGAGVAAVNLFYNVNSGSWVKVTMSVVSGNTYSGTIPNAAYLYNDIVSYYVEAKDNANNYLYRYDSGTTSINATAQGTPLTFTATEDISPSIGIISGEVDPIVETVDQVVTCDVTDSGGAGLTGVNLFYKINSGAWVKVTMSVGSGDTYSGTIPNAAYLYNDIVSYYVEAKDNVNNYLYRYNSGTTSNNATAQVTPLMFTAAEFSISSLSGEVDPIVETVDQVLTCDVTVVIVNLFYKINSGEWVKVSMSFVSGSTYSGNIPNAAYLYGDTVSYYIEAKDNANNYLYRYDSGTTSSNATAKGTPLTFTATENVAPSISVISGEVDPIVETVNQVVTCDVTDSGGAGLAYVYLHYKLNSGSWVAVPMSVVSGDTYSCTIPSSIYIPGESLSYYIEAGDVANNWFYRSSAGTTSNNLTAQTTAFNFMLLAAMEDADEDGMPNLWEYQMGLNMTLNDADVDHDLDGMPNLWEYQMSLNAAVNDAELDADMDGATNLQEYKAGTNATNPDTDGDGYSDGIEIQWHSDPLDKYSNPATFIIAGISSAIIAGVSFIKIKHYIKIKQIKKLLGRDFE
jgi:hypothetical protein